MRVLIQVAVFAAAAIVILPAIGRGAPLKDYVGRWKVANSSSSQGLVDLRIRRRNGRTIVRAIGRCVQNRCDWGRTIATRYGVGPRSDLNRDTRMISAEFRTNVRVRHLLIRKISNDRLQVQALMRFRDGRTPYYNVFILTRVNRPGGPGGRQAVRETCTAFNPDFVVALPIRGAWRLIHLGHTIKSFGTKVWEARRAERIIRNYRLNRLCRADIPNRTFEYWRSGRNIPSGAINGEDCVRVNGRNARIYKIAGRWIVGTQNRRYFAVRSQIEARYALAIMRRTGARQYCFVGRPGPSMTYLRR